MVLAATNHLWDIDKAFCRRIISPEYQAWRTRWCGPCSDKQPLGFCQSLLLLITKSCISGGAEEKVVMVLAATNYP
jgi:hypothetical protein